MAIVKITKKDLVGKSGLADIGEYKFEVVKCGPVSGVGPKGPWEGIEAELKFVESEEYAELWPVRKRFFSIMDFLPFLIACTKQEFVVDDEVETDAVVGKHVLGVIAHRTWKDKKTDEPRSGNDIESFRPVP